MLLKMTFQPSKSVTLPGTGRLRSEKMLIPVIILTNQFVWRLLRKSLSILLTRSQSYQTFFFVNNFFFHFFAFKLGHIIVNIFFHVLQALLLNSKNRKTKFGKINFRCQFHQHSTGSFLYKSCTSSFSFL